MRRSTYYLIDLALNKRASQNLPTLTRIHLFMQSTLNASAKPYFQGYFRVNIYYIEYLTEVGEGPHQDGLKISLIP